MDYSQYQSTTFLSSTYVPNEDEELIPVKEIEYVYVKKKNYKKKKIKVKKH